MISVEEILADPSASDWLKRALRSALDRDCADAANDAEVLAGVLAERSCRATTTLARDSRYHQQDNQETTHA